MLPVLLCCFALPLIFVKPFGATAHAPFTGTRAAARPVEAGVAGHAARMANALGQEIGATLGSLRADDETALRTPFEGMLLAEQAFRSGGDEWSAQQLSRWAEVLATRLNEVAIPPGTRDRLSGLVAVYEHEVLMAGTEETRCDPADSAFASTGVPPR
jgi:hypothetical protein